MNQETTLSEKLNPKHEVFIREMIRHNDKIRAYKVAYPGITDESARVAAGRLLSQAIIKERLKYAYNSIELGVREDKIAFINQELKIINIKRELLLKIISGTIKATVNEKLKAIRLDMELAEQQAKLLGYDSIKQPQDQVQAALPENAETVTNMNKENTTPSYNHPAKPVIKNNRPHSSHGKIISYPVTNMNNYSCSSAVRETIQV